MCLIFQDIRKIRKALLIELQELSEEAGEIKNLNNSWALQMV
jgi:hypothetical protein